MGFTSSSFRSARRIFARVLLVCCSFLISTLLLFALLECFPSLIRQFHLYIVPYFLFKESYIPDKELIFRYRPNYKSVREFQGDLYSPAYGVPVPTFRYEAAFDENGFRNPPGLKSADIVALGDSYLELGLDDSDVFTSRLARHSGLRVTNLGLAWYGPYQYLHVLKRYGLPQKPKYVLFCFFEGNDIADIQEYDNWKSGGSYHYWNQFSKNFFQRYFIAAEQIINFLRSKLNEQNQQANFQDNLAELSLGGKIYKCVFDYPSDPRIRKKLLKTPAWIQLRAISKEFKRISVENNMIPVIIFIPTKEHIYAGYSTDKSGKAWLKIRNQEIGSRENRELAMKQLCENLKLNCISLSPLFESLAEQGRFLYYPFDTHWNSEGRERAAAYVADMLKSIDK